MKRHLSALFLAASIGLTGCGSSRSSTNSGGTGGGPTTSATLSATSFDFGNNLVGNSLTRTAVTVSNTGSTSFTLHPTLSGDPSFAIAPDGSCGAVLAAGAACTVNVSYAPTTVSGATPQRALLATGIVGVPASTPQTVTITGVSGAVAAGSVAATANPQVALYSVNLPFPGSVTVNFGPDTAYGRSTATVVSTVAGPVGVLVAGMRADMPYHMRASLQFGTGVSATDVDHSFVPHLPILPPNVTVTVTDGQTPQPGIELLTITTGTPNGLLATDLQGNLLWSYSVPNLNGIESIQGARLLPNGHFLLTFGLNNDFFIAHAVAPPGSMNVVREIDLAGTTIREISVADLATKLIASGYNIPLLTFHHDVTPLPNGHWIVLSNTTRDYTDLPGYPGLTHVLGDVVVDLDENLNPVWVWNELDHLDPNRHPLSFPDLTHTNAVLYSPTDGNLIVSLRNQNWVVKVDYKNGAGTGAVVWRLGQGGDFSLVHGVDPTDWQYAQHYPSLFTPNSAGVFSLGMMDNGDDRMFPSGTVCGSAGAPVCLYSTIPVYEIDEAAKTATLRFHTILPPNLYSFFGGNTDLLANGHVEYDLTATGNTTSDLFETTFSDSPETVWHMHLNYIYAYRGFRLPSLYPGVQW